METKTMKLTNPQYKKLNQQGMETYFELVEELYRFSNNTEKYELDDSGKFTDIANIVDKYMHRLAHNHNQIKPCESCNHSVLDQH